MLGQVLGAGASSPADVQQVQRLKEQLDKKIEELKEAREEEANNDDEEKATKVFKESADLSPTRTLANEVYEGRASQYSQLNGLFGQLNQLG